MEDRRRELYLANMAELQEMVDCQHQSQGDNAPSEKKTDFLDKRIREVTKTLQATADSCQLAESDKEQCSIVDAFESLTDSEK